MAEEGPVVSGSELDEGVVEGFRWEGKGLERRELTSFHAVVFDIFAFEFVVFRYGWGDGAAGLGVVRVVYSKQFKDS